VALTVGSLFAGIGGFDLGLERAGMEIKWQVEIDPFCRAVLAKHWPNVKRYEDVRRLHAPEPAYVDVICGGFPCQPVSESGRRMAQHDERWMWPDFARLVRELRPKYVLVENVPGLFVRGFGDVLRDLAEIGFDAEWSVLSACAVGAPHTRERVFVVGYPRSERRRSLRPFLVESGREREGLPQIARSETRTLSRIGCASPWHPSEPDAIRMADGPPDRLERRRIAATGNAVVPQIAEWIGRRILEAERQVTP
jgi:DNA (cytosine-5)-methyltransferase 1